MQGRVLIIQAKNCTGCRMCELACSSIKEGMFIPDHSRIRVVADGLEGWSRPSTCLQCEDALCMAACEVQAIHESKTPEGDSIIAVDPEKCIECNRCVEACPFGAIELHEGSGAIKCDLCGGSPTCVRFCSYDALSFVEISEEEYATRAKNIKELTNKIQNESKKYDSHERRLAYALEASKILTLSGGKRENSKRRIQKKAT